MKLLFVDPTGIAYGAELARGLASLVDLTYVTRKNDIDKNDVVCSLKYWFKAPRKNGKFSKVVKGLSYLVACLRMIRYVKKEKVDVVHIQWLSLPQVDLYFLKKLSGIGVRLVFTAHNVLPHRNSDAFIDLYRKYYSFFDKIIVHGESVKKEFVDRFPEYEDKLVIERHGIFDSLSTEIDEKKIECDILDRVKNAKKVGIFFGNMFFNKGVDELVSYWLKKYKNRSDVFLFVVGKLDSGYSELIALEPEISKCGNIFFKPDIIEEIELNTYISLSDVVFMPYKHASMSGIIFKAAVMDRTVLTTNTGAIKEYIDDECAFCVDSIEAFFDTMDELFDDGTEREKLLRMGKLLGTHIRKEYSWDAIAQSTVNDVYKK